MKKATVRIGTVFVLIFFALHVCANGRPYLSIDRAMCLAERNSPLLSVARFQEIAAQRSVEIAQSRYFPTLYAEAIDTIGFAGSARPLYAEGIINSPFRSGLGVDLVAQQVVYDFGRTFYNVEASKYETEYAQQNTCVTAYQVKQLTLEIFYESAMLRTLRDLWAHLSHESAIITKESIHFVNTGQRSVVDQYLSKAETEQARTAQAFFAARLKEASFRLAILMGVSANSFSIPPLPKELTPSLNPNADIFTSPLLTRSIVGAKVAQAKLNREKAGLRPKIVAFVSVGTMDKVKLAERRSYAAGIGITMPLFDLHVVGEIKRAEAVRCAKDQEIAAEQLYLEQMNAKYDEIIRASKIRLQHLRYELELANKGFAVAKKRYFAIEGNLIDLREAFRNLARTQTEIVDTRTKLLQASGAKALLNGGVR
jgi:outer membrane protein